MSTKWWPSPAASHLGPQIKKPDSLGCKFSGLGLSPGHMDSYSEGGLGALAYVIPLGECQFTTFPGASWVKSELTPECGGQEEMEERGQPLQVGRWQLNSKGNLPMSLVLGGSKMSGSLYLLATSKEFLWTFINRGLCWVWSTVPSTILFSAPPHHLKVMSLQQLLGVRGASSLPHSKDRGGSEQPPVI